MEVQQHLKEEGRGREGRIGGGGRRREGGGRRQDKGREGGKRRSYYVFAQSMDGPGMSENYAIHF